MHAKRPPQPRKEPLQLTLLENGVDFVRSAVTLLYSDEAPDDSNYKYAVLHVFAGALLLLKERLRRAHESLIWTNVTEVGDASKSTVDFSVCIERLVKCAGVKFNDSQLGLLKRAQRRRNQLEHYSVDLNLHEAEKLVAEVVEFVFVFLRDELKENLEEDLPEDAWERVQELQQIAGRVHEERERAQFIELEAAHQKELQISSPARAAWLNRAHKYEMLPASQLEALREGDSSDFHSPPPQYFECTQCGGYDSVVSVDADIAICTVPTCRAVFKTHECPRCGGEAVLGGDDDDWCENCRAELAELIERD